ncbi:MAG TPA: diphthine--ammonia ligase [Puia sp.]
MKNKTPVVLSWSGGKDSSYALHQLMNDERYEICYLLSTINGMNKRLSMHGVREELMDIQAAAIGIPLIKTFVCKGTNEEYEQQMGDSLRKLKAEGIHAIAFGDIFLEDLRSYRENQMRQVGMECLFPIWQKDTLGIVNDFIAKRFKAYTCCVNSSRLDESWCGRLIDEGFVKDLPPSADPCGENGEFHSFCFQGPVFKRPLSIITGEKVYKPMDRPAGDPDTHFTGTIGFWYCDLLPS